VSRSEIRGLKRSKGGDEWKVASLKLLIRSIQFNHSKLLEARLKDAVDSQAVAPYVLEIFQLRDWSSKKKQVSWLKAAVDSSRDGSS
jgi:hypothetical protein